ncbi:hypothetical protein BGZ58_010031 [Dissophora ornata]|nr:hypothetical protein BGZ58_010031 [Dissophora ornata]
MASYGSSTEDNPRFGRFHGFERTVVDRTALRSTRATPLGYANRIARLRPYHHLNNLARMEDSTSITENPTAGIFARGASTRARINAARNRPFDLELTRYRSRGMTATGSDGSVYNFSFVRVFDGKRFLSGLSYYANLGPSRHIHRY